MTKPTDPRMAPTTGAAGGQEHDPGLQLAEVMALVTLRDVIAAGDDDAVSGHALRQALRQSGMARLDATLAVHALVGHGLVVRIRRDEPDGRFYTAYQVTTRGGAWLHTHGKDTRAGD